MLFNSVEFWIFFCLFFALYWLFRRSSRARNLVILLGSYVFYAWWDYRYVVLLAGSSLTVYLCALLLERSNSAPARRFHLATALVLNLGLLFYFKYAGFAQASLADLLGNLGVEVHWRPWQILLPVGISFYVFQAMSYIIDVYRRRLPAQHNIVDFMSFVAFFPQLVAGPIERATNLLPQLETTRRVSLRDVELGVWLILWGLFKKVAVADQLAPLVECIYDNPDPVAPLIVLATIAFGVQIYCDFSGYSDIARGLARLLGFRLMLNFNLPYFATNLRDFWRRWHISLSTWLRDYLYIPLGGNRATGGRVGVNLMITMILGGLWHGAALNFLLWGCWHGAGLCLQRWWERSRPRPLPAGLAWGLTAAFGLYGWLLFRASSTPQLMALTGGLLRWTDPGWTGEYLFNVSIIIIPFAAMQLWQHLARDLDVGASGPRWRRAVLQGALLLGVLVFWPEQPPPFIYFQF